LDDKFELHGPLFPDHFGLFWVLYWWNVCSSHCPSVIWKCGYLAHVAHRNKLIIISQGMHLDCQGKQKSLVNFFINQICFVKSSGA